MKVCMSLDKSKSFDCIAAAQYMHEFLDGELQPDLRAVMESHLASCADCTATLAQLRQIETAQRDLDAQLEMPPEAYWQALPQRVMEKVKASEKRRLLLLPKLPRLKSAGKRTSVSAPAPQQAVLHLTPALQKFLRGSGKYVLPLAAAATFCFFVIRGLLEKPETAMMTASAPEPQRVETQSAPEEKMLEKTLASKPAPTAEAPTQESPSRRRAAQQPADERIVLPQDTLLAAAGAGQALSGGIELKTEEPKPVALSEAQPQAAETDIVAPKLEQTQSLAATSSKTKDQPAAPLEKEVLYRAETPAAMKAAKTADDQLAQSAESRAKKVASPGRTGVSSTAMQPAGNLLDTPFNQALQRAQQTADLNKREKIWRDFLKSNPDSSSRALAIVALGRALVASSDSTTQAEQLEKNITFFRENAATLRAQMGETEYDRELTRLQMLLNFRKSQ